MNFLFDIGNVLLLLDFPSFQRRVFGNEGPSVEIEQTFWALKDPFETGKITAEDFINQALTVVPAHISSEDLTAAWNKIFSPHQPMWDLVDRLKADGHTLILFSNTNALHANYFLNEFSVFDHFDHHHFSHEVGAIKPAPDFYTTAIEQYGLTPSETLYLDDLPENIEAGEKQGFQCHQYDFNNHEAALEWLDQRL